jgi:exopolysaccharide biosynthesis polyprenyl glycosylphosphotransferase
LTFTVLLLIMVSVYGGYDIGKRKSRPVISSLILAVAITDVVTYLQLEIMNVNIAKYKALTLFGWDFLLLVYAMVAQIVIIILMTRVGNRLYFDIHPPEKCCIVFGSAQEAEHVAAKISRYRLQYALTDMADYRSGDVEECILRSDTVFFAQVPAKHRGKLLEFCYEHQKNVYTAADLYDVMVANGRQVILDDSPFVAMGRGGLEMHEIMVKRIMDIVISAVGLLLVSPVMLLASIAILLEDGGPVFFRQERMTIGGSVFEILKFRTMRKGPGQDGPQVSVRRNDERITKVGAYLRKARLDELPQLFNILKGDMSMVGPRPEMLENVRKYSREVPAFAYRQKMKAGLTGYAQIEGRYNTSARDKLMMDLMYIESYSIWLDVKLLLRTLTVFFKADSTEGFLDKTEDVANLLKKGEEASQKQVSAKYAQPAAAEEELPMTRHSAG